VAEQYAAARSGRTRRDVIVPDRMAPHHGIQLDEAAGRVAIAQTDTKRQNTVLFRTIMWPN
jgi:hypothetical protein